MFKPFRNAIGTVHLVEASPTQRNFQRHLFCEKPGTPLPPAPMEAHSITEGKTRDGIHLKWHFHIDDVQNGSDPPPLLFSCWPHHNPFSNSFLENRLFFVAHEFFDAIPVHQFEVRKVNWFCGLLGPKCSALFSSSRQLAGARSSWTLTKKRPAHFTFG